jgi:hypothetical protein
MNLRDAKQPLYFVKAIDGGAGEIVLLVRCPRCNSENVSKCPRGFLLVECNECRQRWPLDLP